MNTMYDTLLQLPLFQGLCQEDFTRILDKVKLDFARHKAGEVILKAGTPCDRFMFILKGEVTCATTSTDASYTFTEHFLAPHLIEPQSMFGMSTTYVSTYVARNEVHTVNISKMFVMNELFNYDIFRLNYINIISNHAQNLNSRLWNKTEESLERRITSFVLAHIDRPAGQKLLKIKMEKLATIVNDTRMNVSKALNDMQGKGMLELHRGEIIIPNAEGMG